MIVSPYYVSIPKILLNLDMDFNPVLQTGFGLGLIPIFPDGLSIFIILQVLSTADFDFRFKLKFINFFSRNLSIILD